MSFEEAKKIFLNRGFIDVDGGTIFDGDKWRQACVVISDFLKDIKALEQEPKWIPISERLPKKDESVLLTICANSSLYGFNENFVKVMCGSYSPCEDERDWIVNEIRYYIDNVIAWMPLPKPYKEAE